MNKVFIAILFIAVIIISSCNSADKERQKTIAEITNIEESLFSDSVSIMNHKKAKQLIELYTVYTNKYPTDSLAPNYLFKAGELAMNLNLSTQAIILLNRFEKEYSQHPKMPYCIFFQAFIYENQMNNLDKAKQYYQRFIDDYPNHELVDDAQSSIENLGKPLEEILKEFEENKN